MKKFFLAMALASCFFMSQGQDGTIDLNVKGTTQECTASSINGFEASFVFDEIQSTKISTEKGTFSQLVIPNTYPTGADGTPELPAARKLIAIPQGANPRVIVKNYTETEYKLSEFGMDRIYPHQPSVMKGTKPEDIKFIFNEDVYASKGYEDRPVAQVAELGTMRGMRIGALTVNPVIYNASTNTIIVRNNIDVEVVFDNADKAATQSLFESTYSIYFKPIYDQMINDDVYDEHPDLYNTPVHMMVVCPDEWIETLQPWVEWKTMKGFYVDVYPTSETGSNYNSIQSFIHTKYAEGVEQNETPTFLVLVGDVDRIPGTTGSHSSKVTDLYYSSVDGDYFPEMYSSRMSVQNANQLEAVINKALVYEKLDCDPSYLSEVLLIAGADYGWNPEVGQPAINYAHEYHFTEENGYTDVHKYLNSYSGCYNWLNSGVAVANYTAHGSETSWSDPYFGVSNVHSLTNTDKYFLAIGNCCVSGNFSVGECFGEAMIRAEEKAAYAYIGSCPNTYWFEDFYWAVGATHVRFETPTPEESSIGVYDGLNMTDMYNTVNSMVFLGNLAVCYAHDNNYGTHSSPTYYWQAYHTFGDGSIMPYNFGVPETQTISHMDIVPIGMDYFEVTALPGSMVAVSKDGVLHGTAVVDETGIVQVPLNPVITSGGLANVVVTRPNTAPVIVELECAALDGPYLIGDDYSINDANEDGIFDYSENGTIGYSIKNVGSELAENIIVTIETSDVSVTFTDYTAEFGNIAANEIGTVDDAFSVTVAPNVRNGHVVECIVTMTCGDEVWTDEIEFMVYAPVLSLSSHGVEGQLLPGETLNLTATFTNSGNADIYNAMGVYSTDCEYITINTTEPVAYGNIPAGESATGAFSITVSPDAPFGTIVTSYVNITADLEYTYVESFEPFIDICNVAINTFPYEEGYEDVELPNCWTQEIVNGDAMWTTKDGGLGYHPYHAHSGEFNAYIADDADSTVVKLVSPLINLSNLSEPTLTFWHAQSSQAGNQDKLRVFYKNSTDGEWQLLAEYQYSLANWKEREIALPNGTANYYIAFEAELNGGYGVVVDDVRISGIGSSILGDADGNSVIDVNDIMVTVNYIVGNDPQAFIFENADVNVDGSVNILDVMGIANLIMNGKANVVSYDVNAEYFVKNGALYIDSPVDFGGLQVNFAGNADVEYFTIDGMSSVNGNNTYVAYSMDKAVAAGEYAICDLNGANIESVVLSDIYGNNINIVDRCVLGINDGANMTLPYPNPFSGSLNIAYTINDANSNVEIVVSNLNGQIVERIAVDNTTVGTFETRWTPSSHVESGVYFVSLNINGENVQVSKVVYNK